jgi:hypothetical protein
MEETKRAWDEVGERFAELGRMISERYRRLGEERTSQPTTAEEDAWADAVRRATDEVDRAFTSLGGTLRDETARQHLRETGRKLTDALKVTFTEASEEVRLAMGGRQSTAPSEPAPPPDPPAGADHSA